jgi:tetratricopeptide (TPR) repeat protein
LTGSADGRPPADRPSGVVALLQLADGWIAQGDLEQAAERLHEMRILFPHDQPAIAGAAKRLREMGRFDLAADVLASWPEDNPNLWVEWEHALLARARGDDAATLAAYRRIRDRFPADSLGHSGLIECLLNAQQWADAEIAIAVATARFPRDAWIWHWAALVAESCGEWDLALRRWLTICCFAPGHADAEIGVVRLLVELGRLNVDDVKRPLQRWDRSALFFEADPGACPETIDLTGAPRNLVHGPYVPLQPGIWRAVINFELCPDAARRRLSLSFGCNSTKNITEREVSPAAGPQQVVIEHAVQDGDNTSLALALKRHAFHGEVRFHAATVERLRDL